MEAQIMAKNNGHSIDITVSAKRRRLLHCLIQLFFICSALLVVLPLLLIISSAFKNEMEIFDYPIRFIPKQIILSNFERLKNSFPLYIFNSFKLTAIITLLQLFTASTGAYAFSKLKWKGRDILFLLYVSSVMIPIQVEIIPQFIIVRNLGLYDSHLAVILLYTFTAFGTFLIKQYFMTIPDSLLEAARIDGANEFYIYAKIMLPLAKPVLATQAILSVRAVWNDFFISMIYLTSEKLKTLPLGMAMFTTEYYTYYGPQMAACLISIIPVMVVFILFQKYIVQGVASSGLKG
jgi:multiple sugar transport system permease protein